MRSTRRWLLALGVFYLLLALSEILLGSEGLIVRNHQVLLFARYLNVLHWTIGIVLVLAALLPFASARPAALVLGLALLALTIVGTLLRLRIGEAAGFTGALPWAYNGIHALSALVVLAAAFLAAPARRGVVRP